MTTYIPTIVKVRAPHQDHIDSNPYISDSSAYQDIVDLIKDDKSGTPQFLQLVTMQNHTPYNDWYEDNEFKEANTSTELSGWERDNSDTYAKGVNYTDTATADFLNKLNEIDQPITVVFYGDHLPGILSNSFDDSNNDLPLHETDYLFGQCRITLVWHKIRSGDFFIYFTKLFYGTRCRAYER